MVRFSTRAALAGVAAAALSAGSASAQSLDLNYFWEYSEVGGVVTNQLHFISTSDSFTAQLFAETVGANNFLNATGDLLPGGGANASFFDGGPQDPILVGSVDGTGVARIDSVVDATWISDWPNDVFPVGTPSAPIDAGQFSVGNAVNGQYTIRINNAAGPSLEIAGTIVNGRFSQSFLGDANLDGDVDVFQAGGQGDIQIVLDNLGTGTTLLTGDVSGDNDVDVFQAGGQGDIQIVLDNLGNTSASTRSSEASATYDATTGELTFNIFGDVQLVGVQSNGNFDTGVTPGSLSLFGGAVDADPLQFDEDSIAFFFGAGQAFDQGSVNIGAVLAAGLSESDLTFEYTPVGGTTTQGSVVVVPEPGSITLLGIAGLALVRRRRSAA
jgi:hypothetical protein